MTSDATHHVAPGIIQKTSVPRSLTLWPQRYSYATRIGGYAESTSRRNHRGSVPQSRSVQPTYGGWVHPKIPIRLALPRHHGDGLGNDATTSNNIATTRLRHRGNERPRRLPPGVVRITEISDNEKKMFGATIAKGFSFGTWRSVEPEVQVKGNSFRESDTRGAYGFQWRIRDGTCGVSGIKVSANTISNLTGAVGRTHRWGRRITGAMVLSTTQQHHRWTLPNQRCRSPCF